MNQTATALQSSLYLDDETAWLEKMSQIVAKRRFDELDCANLSEYLADTAIRDRREVISRLRVLLAHLLKWEKQPRKRTRSWKVTIDRERAELRDIFESKTLRNHAQRNLAKAFQQAARHAAIETGIALTDFPKSCAYTLEEIIGSEDHDDLGPVEKP